MGRRRDDDDRDSTAVAAVVNNNGDNRGHYDTILNEEDDEEEDLLEALDDDFEHDNNDDDSYDEEYHMSPTRFRGRRRTRHRRTTRRGPPTSLNTMNNDTRGVTYCLLYVLFALVVTAVALVGWKEANKRDNLNKGTTTTPIIGTEDDDSHNDDLLGSSNAVVGRRPEPNVVHYDPSVPLHPANPFDLHYPHDDDSHGSMVQPPLGGMPSYGSSGTNNEQLNQGRTRRKLGYMMQPNVVNNTLVFVSEGDMYLTSIVGNNRRATEGTNPSTMPTINAAMKLTTTVGNVQTPVINPTYPYLVAYTATYTGRREVYVLDMRTRRTSSSSSTTTSTTTRLTYWDTGPIGIVKVVGWKDDGMTLVFAAESNDATSLPDVRLYQLSLLRHGSGSSNTNGDSNENNAANDRMEHDGNKDDKDNENRDDEKLHPQQPSLQVWQIRPIPLTEARDGMFHNDCLYFVRFAQSSSTVRYVGGTAESLWAYCEAQPRAIPLTTLYHGTDKSPRLYQTTTTTSTNMDSNGVYILFLSDRLTSTSTTQAASMNLWAMPLPLGHDLYNGSDNNNNNNGSNNKDTNATTLLQEQKQQKQQQQFSLVQLTQVSCDFDGRALLEFAVDDVTGNIVLRIGADLYVMKRQDVEKKLSVLNEEAPFETTSTGKHDKQPKDGSSNGGESKDKHKNRNDGNDKNRTLASSQHDRDISSSSIQSLNIAVMSDFHEHQERLIPVKIPQHVTTVDVYQTAFGSTSAVLGLRGQLYVTPVVTNVESVHPFAGAGMNLPLRRYRVGPGIAAGGSVRIQAAKYVPLFMEKKKDARRLALVLATDPKSETAEHGFYLLETQSDAPQVFVNMREMPDPFLGGSKDGGSVADGGLGTVNADTVSVSPCGRRFAWTDRDGRICVMAMPMYQNETSLYSYKVLPQENEQGQPMIGTEADLSWSPGGRYLAIRHAARNQFDIISIADLGNPEQGDIMIGRIVQATPDRFNSGHAYWGKTSLDFKLKKQQEVLSQLAGKSTEPSDGATVLYFLSDRDLMSDVKSPWGTRQPSPHFPKQLNVYALPLVLDEDERGPLTTTRGTFGGGGASELWVDNILALEEFVETAMEKSETPTGTGTRHLMEILEHRAMGKTATGTFVKSDESLAIKDENSVETTQTTQDDSTRSPIVEPTKASPFPQDREIFFGVSNSDLSFARRAYRLGNIRSGDYATISQPLDDPSLMVIETVGGKSVIKIFSVSDFPSDSTEPMTVELEDNRALAAFSFTTTREHLVLFFSPGEIMKVVENSAAGLVSLIQDKKVTKNIADTGELALSVWPALEYQQMYDDAWRLLRDYFYDPGMNGIDWPEMHARYRALVERCSKREELDDVLRQMAAELSALHVFVYGGEYRHPLHENKVLDFVHETASLGATLKRTAEWKGYVVTAIAERDPDFNLVDGKPSYSPLSNPMLQLTGQRGLEVGDVIVGVNGESVMRVPDIHMLLRGTKGRSVRLDVLRLASGSTRKFRVNDLNQTLGNQTAPDKNTTTASATAPTANVATVEPLITVPISLEDAQNLRYGAWEYKTRQLAKATAETAGFTVGYVHLRSMSGPQDIDAFYRNFFPDYNKEAFIVDVRHNRGGSIDSWLLDMLQRRAWMYWQGRTTNITNGGLGWDEHFSFRGHIVVLMDEHTSSDGEGFARGVSELGLGKLIGKRTWGGGIWLSSDNHLVDGGIATAPEVGTYNDKFGWGLGIEQMGVEPDVEVDNDPRMAVSCDLVNDGGNDDDGGSTGTDGRNNCGRDQQLEYAIQYLKEWIEREPIVLPKNPGAKRDMSIPKEAMDSCHAG